MSASIEAALRLDIAELQQKLTLANTETDKWKAKLEASGGKGSRAIDDVSRAYGRLNTAAQSSGRIISANTAMFMQAEKAATAAAKAQSGRAGRGMALGGAAMQVQDIAVQLQMGTKLSTVIAQQGSQMLSVFGVGGAMMGGLVAVGGAFVTMGQNAHKSLAEAIQGAKDLRTEVDALAMGGSLEEITAKIGTLGSRSAAALQEAATATQGWKGYFTELIAVFGGPTGNDIFAGLQKAIMAAAEARQKLEAAAVDASGRQLEIDRLRATGQNDQADSKERELKLAREIARIEAAGFSKPITDSLRADAYSRFGLGAMGAPFDQKKAQAEITAFKEKQAAAELAALDPAARHLRLTQMQQEVFARMDQEGGAFFDKSIQGLQDWATYLEQSTGKTQELLNVTRMLQQALDLEKQRTAASDEAGAGVAASVAATQQANSLAETQRINDFIATSSPGSSPPSTLNSQPSTSSGRSPMRRRLMGSAGGGGLNAFYRMQQTASSWEMLQRGPSAWQSLQNGVDQGSMGLAGARNAASTAAANQDRKTGDPTSILSELLKVTQRGLLGS
jgi:hypothetical protein